MKVASHSSLEYKIALAVLKLAAKYDWHMITPEQISKTTRVPLSQVKRFFSSPDTRLRVILRYIDSEMIKSVGKINSKSSLHDRLFEILMARFDVLQSHRKGIISIAAACRKDPKLLQTLLQAQWLSMQKVFQLAQLDQKSTLKITKWISVFSLYHLVLWYWQHDHTKDMAKTMAVLDRVLRLGDKLYNPTFITD